MIISIFGPAAGTASGGFGAVSALVSGFGQATTDAVCAALSEALLQAVKGGDWKEKAVFEA